MPTVTAQLIATPVALLPVAAAAAADGAWLHDEAPPPTLEGTVRMSGAARSARSGVPLLARGWARLAEIDDAERP